MVNIMKKIFSLILVMLFGFSISSPIFCDDFDLDNFINSSGDIDIDKLFDEIGGNEDLKPSIDTSKLRVGSVGLSFWDKTYGSRTRDPLFLVPQRKLIIDNDGISSYLFFNMTNQLLVAPNMVFNMKAMDPLLKFADGDNDFDASELGTLGTVIKVLPYMKSMTAQERRIGALLSGGFSKGRFVCQAELPLLFVERNYWLEDKQERNALQDVLDRLTSVNKGSAIKTKFGLGDAKIKAGYKFIDAQNVKSAIGLSAILPTSKFFTKSPKNVITSKVGDPRDKLMSDLLNVGKEIIIDPKLATGHWGMGCFWEFKTALIPKKLDFWSRLSFDYLFKGSEHRFLPSNTKVPFAEFLGLVEGDTIPEGFPISDVFPTLAKVTVSPGHIYNATAGIDWNLSKNWKFQIGYDFYLQQAEKIEKIHLDNLDLSTIVVEDAISPRVMQHKIFGGIDYINKGKSRDWHFGVGGDWTFAKDGTGRDWTVFAKIGITF